MWATNRSHKILRPMDVYVPCAPNFFPSAVTAIRLEPPHDVWLEPKRWNCQAPSQAPCQAPCQRHPVFQTRRTRNKFSFYDFFTQNFSRILANQLTRTSAGVSVCLVINLTDIFDHDIGICSFPIYRRRPILNQCTSIFLLTRAANNPTVYFGAAAPKGHGKFYVYFWRNIS